MPPVRGLEGSPSNPRTSSPCQQCRLTGTCLRVSMAASVSTPKAMYFSRASVYCMRSSSFGLLSRCASGCSGQDLTDVKTPADAAAGGGKVCQLPRADHLHRQVADGGALHRPCIDRQPRGPGGHPVQVHILAAAPHDVDPGVMDAAHLFPARSEERRVGTEW